jgi:LmbE family N-acetylglucosaminyl deacetylase
MVTAHDLLPGNGRTLLAVLSHADDFAIFAGGTLARFSDEGWRVVGARATDDRWDSVGLSESETIAANAAELAEAARILGMAEIVELGYPTDTLGDVSELELRERVIRLIREHRPYALLTFDPYSMFAEDNQDHVRLAQAVDEAFWTAQFDKHHPDQIAAGMEPHGVFERWYVGRRVVEVTDVVDIAATLDRKVEAVCAHETPMRNFANQLRLQARTGGYSLPVTDQVLAGGEVRLVVEPLLRAAASAAGSRHGLEAAEEFRVVRFGGLVDWLEQNGRAL